jgi:hypothetical protein
LSNLSIISCNNTIFPFRIFDETLSPFRIFDNTIFSFIIYDYTFSVTDAKYEWIIWTENAVCGGRKHADWNSSKCSSTYPPVTGRNGVEEALRLSG